MTPRRNKSRKRSAARSNAKRLESAVFYLDESIYSRVLCEELERVGMSVRRPGVDVPFGTPDAEWLGRAGSEGWIVLMRDQRVRHRALELQALRIAKVGAFVLTAGQATAESTADRSNKGIKNHGQKFTLRLIQQLGRRGNVTLMCHCGEDEMHCHRHLLAKILAGKIG